MKKTKGILIIIGGDRSLPPDIEDVENNSIADIAASEGQILHKFCGLLAGNDSRIEVIPTASNVPEEISQRYSQAFQNLGFANVGILD
ncbi:MAG: cyanophycinase, partial [Desulfohalobiaceae bacterium]